MFVEVILPVLLASFIIVLPFQGLGFLTYFFGKNLLPSHRAWLTILIPSVAFFLAFIIFLVTDEPHHDEMGIGLILKFMCFVVGIVINTSLSSLLLKFLKRREFTARQS